MKLAQLKNPIVGDKLNPSSGVEAVGQFNNVVQVIITSLLVVASIFFVFNFIIGGIRWITSGGDKARIEGARSSILNAVVGLVVVFSVFVILSLLESLFGVNLLQIDVGVLRMK